MNALTHKIPPLPRSRLGEWAARAWQRMGWRHVVLALALRFLREVFGPLGGLFFVPINDPPGWQGLIEQFLSGAWVAGGVWIVYCVLVADEAFDDGVPPLRAYGLAVIAMAAIVPVADWFLAGLMGWYRQGPPTMAWWAQAMLFQGGLGMSIYAYWRVTQRAMRRAQAAETDRVRDEQRVQTARLLTLQSRVEPQMLFDSLGRIGELHVREPEAADALLADLIALLRAMLPGAKVDNSTVQREFALVEAWLRVTRHAARTTARVQLRMTPDARPVGIAPMLVLPLLRAVLALPCATPPAWVLSAKTASHRLIVTLESEADAGAEVAGLLERADLSSLHDRLTQLFGRSAHLTASSQPPTLTLDLPRLQEDSDDDRADR